MAEKIGTQDLRKLLRNRETVIVLFSGEWCPDCRGFKPTWDTWRTGKAVKLHVLDVPRGGAEWKDWGLDEIPTVCAFSRGKETARVHGTIGLDVLDGLLEKISSK